jgi:light-regulated signal transduction histidine kinase (bacteriophytochrome)
MEYFRNKVPGNFTVIFISALATSLAFGIWTFVELRKRISFQASLEQHIVQLNQHNAELEQIAFAASHDLQEPIRKIRIFSERLKNASPEEFRESAPGAIDKINRFAVRLHGLIADLSNLIDAVRSDPEKQIVSLSAVLAEVEKKFQQEITSAGCKIIQSDLPAVEASDEQLKTMFSNLLSNSLHFASPERKPVIIIAADVVNGRSITGLPKQLDSKTYSHIKFQDNGIGFDPQFRSRIFMPFQRLHNDESQQVKRKGMGLAICKRIMVNLGGWIDAEGQEGKGAAIHLYFPFKAEQATPGADEAG